MERVRLELKRESEQAGGAKVLSETEHHRLMSAMQENSVLRNLNASFTKDQQALRDSLTASEERVAKLSAELEALRTAHAAAKSDMLVATQEAASRAHEAKLLQQRLDDVLRRLGGAQGASKEELDRANSQIQALETTIKTHESDLASIKETKDKLEQDLANSKSLEKRLRELGLKQKAQGEESKATLVKLEEAQKTAETQREEAVKARDEAKAQTVSLETELAKLKEQFEKKDALLQRFRQMVEKHKEDMEKVNVEKASLTAELETLKKSVAVPVARVAAKAASTSTTAASVPPPTLALSVVPTETPAVATETVATAAAPSDGAVASPRGLKVSV